jgi:hypothetical protein
MRVRQSLLPYLHYQFQHHRCRGICQNLGHHSLNCGQIPFFPAHFVILLTVILVPLYRSASGTVQDDPVGISKKCRVVYQCGGE